MPSTRARAVIAVGLAVKPVGQPDAGNPHVRFDERGRETGCCRMAQATAPVLDSTKRRCIGALIGSKLLCHNDLAQARGAPRCQHSVTLNTSSLHRSRDARL